MNRLIVFLLSAALWASFHGGPGEAEAKSFALDVPYEPTSYGIARAMLELAGVASGDLVYDLGCGDGRLVILAAKERGATGVGVDLDPQRIRESRENARIAGVADRVRFFEQNLFATDFSRASVVMLYLYPEVNLRLRPKLLKDLRPGTRIVSHSHSMGDWEEDATWRIEGHYVRFFVVPANASGTWTWAEPGGQAFSLSLTQKYQRVKGTLSVGDETYPLAECSLRGSRLRLTVDRLVRGRWETFFFEGEIDGDTIRGRIASGGTREKTEPWQAVREPGTLSSIAD